MMLRTVVSFVAGLFLVTVSAGCDLLDEVSSLARGQVEVQLEVSGTPNPGEHFVVTVPQGQRQTTQAESQSASIEPGERVRFVDVPTGVVFVELTEVPSNCEVDSREKRVTVPEDRTVSVTFSSTCR